MARIGLLCACFAALPLAFGVRTPPRGPWPAPSRLAATSKHSAQMRASSKAGRLPGWRSQRSPGHTISGVEINAAGIVPYTEVRGRGVIFLLQKMINGTRAGKLCDFGGRREESDNDLFFTAAREFTEETGGCFGDVDALAKRLRTDASIRILNRPGRYMTFFLKVDYVEPDELPEVDQTSDASHARICNWWRADELLGGVSEERLLARMVNPRFGSGDTTVGLSSFHKAVCKTLALENAQPDSHDRWHSTVLSELVKEGARRQIEEEAAALYIASTALACASGPGGASSSRPRRAEPRRANSRGKVRKPRSRPLDLRGFSP